MLNLMLRSLLASSLLATAALAADTSSVTFNRDVLPVHLRSHISEVGTLELHLVSGAGRAWKLEFSVRQE